MTRTREELLQAYTSDEERLLAAKVIDKLTAAEKTWDVVCTDFYDPAQMIFIEQLIKRRGGDARVAFHGGYALAERCKACIARTEVSIRVEDYSLAVLRIEGNFSFFKVRHSDFMGALLSLGLRREKLGDIIAEDDGAFLVVDEQIANQVQISLERVGRAPVTVSYSTFAKLAEWHPIYQTSTVIAASPRLDAVTAAIYNLSRSEAAALIARGHVKLNHVPCTTGSKGIKPGDLVSARGYGRAYVREFVGLTHKDRMRVRIDRPL